MRGRRWALLGCAAALATASRAGGEDATRPSVPAPDPAAAEVAPGFRVEIAAKDLLYPSSVEFDDAGAMYVAECGYFPGEKNAKPRILKVTSSERTDVCDPALLKGPITDLLWHGGKLYVSHKTKISVVENGRLRDLVTDLPSLGDHSNDQMAVGPDGKIYFGQGSATNSGVVGEDNFAFGWPKEHPEVCEVPAKDVVLTSQTFETDDVRPGAPAAGGEAPKKAKTSAFQPFGITAPAGTVIPGRTKANGAVLRMNADGSDLEVYAWGFRNPYGVQWTPDGRLFVADAGSDERGSRPIAGAPEKLFNVKPNAWYGWPDFEGGVPVTDARFKSPRGGSLKFVMAKHPAVERPFMTFDPHASVTQMDVSRGAAFGRPGDIFLGASGDQSAVTAASEVRAGYWVQRVTPTTARAETFFRARADALGPKGLEYVTTAGPKRIVDVRFSPAGDALYVVDIGPIHYVEGDKGPEPVAFPGTGVIWKIVPEK